MDPEDFRNKVVKNINVSVVLNLESVDIFIQRVDI